MTRFELGNEEKIILLCTKLTLNQHEIQLIDDFVCQNPNWNSFIDKTTSNRITPFIYRSLYKIPNKEKIPKNIYLFLKKKYIQVFFNNSKKISELKSIVNALNNHKIDFIPLKGIVLIPTIYNDLGIRSMTDIDILVKEIDVERSKNLFLELGWKIRDEHEISDFVEKISDSQHPYTFVKNTVKIELHNKIHSGLSSYSININHYWERSIPIDFLDSHSFVFSRTDFLQHLCIHLHKHLINEKQMSIKHFCDIREFILKYSSEINWNELVSTSSQYKCSVEVREILSISSIYFNAPIPENIIKEMDGVSEFDCQLLFINFLTNNKDKNNKLLLNKHDIYKQNFKQIKDMKNKLIYIFKLFIPSRKFMMNRYNLKNKHFVYLFYFKRIGVGIFKSIKSR